MQAPLDAPTVRARALDKHPPVHGPEHRHDERLPPCAFVVHGLSSVLIWSRDESADAVVEAVALLSDGVQRDDSWVYALEWGETTGEEGSRKCCHWVSILRCKNIVPSKGLLPCTALYLSDDVDSATEAAFLPTQTRTARFLRRTAMEKPGGISPDPTPVRPEALCLWVGHVSDEHVTVGSDS